MFVGLLENDCQWSFAVTLWELFTFADRPYGDVVESNSVVDFVAKGNRLPQPTNCPSQL